ncbi:hypothetical protein [Acidovorax sp.]|uniref:hypothetical protein n=1 Tax=Acidovorax sp. TaxID=1872122 RepID=UPI003D069009
MNWTLTGAASALLGLAACSPALNWRSVALPEAALTITLPCKPDHAARKVELAGTPVDLSMVGCEADGATFAVSHTTLADPAQTGVALAHWRAAVLARLGGAQAQAHEVPFVPRNALPLPQSVRTVAQGKGPDGQTVTAQAVWFARTVGPQMQLYHAVVYTPRPRPEVADTFFSGLVLP